MVVKSGMNALVITGKCTVKVADQYTVGNGKLLPDGKLYTRSA
jgi:hypothetical protein